MSATRPGVDLEPLIGRGGDALLVVPPFAQTSLAAFGPHLLQACARAAGFRVGVLYGSLAYARRVGADWYDAFCRDAAFPTGFPGERVFARAAHGLPPLGRNAGRMYDLAARVGPAKAAQLGDLDLVHPPFRRFPRRELLAADRAAVAWAEELAEAIAKGEWLAVGCSVSFDQTNAGFALLRALRRRRPGVATLLGGGNCFGPMADGVASLDPSAQVVDHVFEGESERTFVEALATLRAGRRPATRVIHGVPTPLADLPAPDYADFERQMAAFLPERAGDPAAADVVAESSRGCGRGARGHCTFCGLNGEQRAWRRKGPSRVAEEVADLARRHPGRRVFLADTLVPPDVVAALGTRDGAADGAGLHVCVPPRIPPSLAARLARAGATLVEPGFEALDTGLLTAMRKGTTAADTVRSLRALRARGIHPYWNLLWGFPGEDVASYRRTLERMPLLHHLAPPRVAYHVSIDRSCPYHQEPSRFGIRSIRPLPSYADLFPEGADLDRIASHFVGDYDCDAYRHGAVIRDLLDRLDRWQAAWSDLPPTLAILNLGGAWVLADGRECTGAPGLRRLSGPDEARLLLTDAPRDDGEAQAAALHGMLALDLDGRFVPLACAAPGVEEALAGAEKGS